MASEALPAAPKQGEEATPSPLYSTGRLDQDRVAFLSISLPEQPGTAASLKGWSPFCLRARKRNSKPGENLPKGPQGSHLLHLEKPQCSDEMDKELSFRTRQRETLSLLPAEPPQRSRHLWEAARSDPSR